MKKNLEFIWIVLIILSIFAFLLGYLKLVSSSLVVILFISTFIKGQLVIDYFMGLKEVEFKYRIIPTLWLSVVLSLVALAYYVPIGKL